MTLLALLTMRRPGESDQLTGLRSLAQECDIDVEEITLDQFRPSLADDIRSQVRRLLREAAGWIVVAEYDAIPQLHALSLLGELRERVVAGGRLFLSLPEDQLNEANALAAPFDITGTDWRIRRLDMRDAYSLEFAREKDQFRDASLLTGVDKVIFNAASALWYAGNAQPVLSFGRDPETESLALVCGRTDFHVSEFTWQEVTPLVLSYTEQNGGLLAASSIGFICDPVRTIGGLWCQGIDANRSLARNILRFLTSAGLPPRQHVRDALRSLEINLAEFVKCVGEATFGGEWWNHLVPEDARGKGESRRRKNLPPISGLDLVDFRRIIAGNWDLFLPYLTSVLGLVQSKSRGLAWLDVIPDIRNTASHPVREHYGDTIDESRRAAVYDAARVANELRKRASRA